MAPGGGDAAAAAPEAEPHELSESRGEGIHPDALPGAAQVANGSVGDAGKKLVCASVTGAPDDTESVKLAAPGSEPEDDEPPMGWELRPKRSPRLSLPKQAAREDAGWRGEAAAPPSGCRTPSTSLVLPFGMRIV